MCRRDSNTINYLPSWLYYTRKTSARLGQARPGQARPGTAWLAYTLLLALNDGSGCHRAIHPLATVDDSQRDKCARARKRSVKFQIQKFEKNTTVKFTFWLIVVHCCSSFLSSVFVKCRYLRLDIWYNIDINYSQRELWTLPIADSLCWHVNTTTATRLTSINSIFHSCIITVASLQHRHHLYRHLPTSKVCLLA